MKIYRVTRRGSGDEHEGYSYYSNKKTANTEQDKENKQESSNDEVETIETEISAKAIIKLLNIHASYPNNG